MRTVQTRRDLPEIREAGQLLARDQLGVLVSPPSEASQHELPVLPLPLNQFHSISPRVQCNRHTPERPPNLRLHLDTKWFLAYWVFRPILDEILERNNSRWSTTYDQSRGVGWQITSCHAGRELDGSFYTIAESPGRLGLGDRKWRRE
jgi:hypothetical protein